MKIKMYQIDAFTTTVFCGNPAAVCVLESWLGDDILQKLAMENNLSETVFCVKNDDSYDLKWFTPITEVDLCGHGTLAAAWVLRNEYGEKASPIRFFTRSGELRVSEDGGKFVMDFPLQSPVRCAPPPRLLQALGVEAEDVLCAEDYLVVVRDEETVRELKPDFFALKGLPLRGVIVTAPGDNEDFVSRWFGPNVGVNEDPVTGSSHTTLAPYWAERTGKNVLAARQISQRSGQLLCRVEGRRVYLTGTAVKYLEGWIYFDDEVA